MSENESRATRIGTLVATGLGLFMIFLDATIVNVALPDIQKEYGVGESGLQWVVAAYTLTMGMFMMSSATLADSHGRRKAYMGGIVLFCAASVACGLAPSLTVLSVSRGLQGVGAAVVNVASLALVSAAYPEPRAKVRAIGIWTGIAAVGLAIGPSVGGVLTETLGWRSIFLVNPAVGAVAIVLTLIAVGESKDPDVRRYDLAGQILFMVGVGSVTYALVEAPHSGWTSPLILSLLIGSVVVAGAFVRVELRTKDPMMDVRVFRDKIYTTAILTIFAVLFAIYGTLLVITQYFQNVRGYSPEQAGLAMLAGTVPTIILAPIAGNLSARLGGRRPTLAGVTSLTAGLVIMAVTMGGWIGFTLIGFALVAAAGGLAVTPATSVAMSSIPPERAGMASGIMSSQRALGSTAGFAIMGSVLALVVAATLPGAFEPYIPDEAQRTEAVDEVVDEANPRAVVSLLAPGKPLADDVSAQPELVEAADDAFVSGIRAALLTALVLVVGALIAGYFVFPRGGPDEGARAETEEAVQLET